MRAVTRIAIAALLCVAAGTMWVESQTEDARDFACRDAAPDFFVDIRVPPPPADAATWSPEAINAAVQASSVLRSRALDGAQALLDLAFLGNLVCQAPERAFGRVRGADSFKFVNAVEAQFGVAVAGEAGSIRDRLNGLYAAAEIALALTIGSEGPGKEMRPDSLADAERILGRTRALDKSDAMRMIENAKARAWEAIEQGVAAGVVGPPKPETLYRSQ